MLNDVFTQNTASRMEAHGLLGRRPLPARHAEEVPAPAS